MTEELKQKLLSLMIEEVICDFLIIKSDSMTLYLTNNSEPVTAFGHNYTPIEFDFAQGDIFASDSTTSLKITDVDRSLTQLVQTAESSIEVDVFTLSLSDLDSYIDGPEHFYAKSVQIASASSEVTLSLGKNSVLNYNCSSQSYNNRLFPGLF